MRVIPCVVWVHGVQRSGGPEGSFRRLLIPSTQPQESCKSAQHFAVGRICSNSTMEVLLRPRKRNTCHMSGNITQNIVTENIEENRDEVAYSGRFLPVVVMADNIEKLGVV